MNRRALVALAGALGIVVVVAGSAGAYLLLRPSATPTVALGPPMFVDETATSGLDHTYGDSDTATIGGGVAVFDCDDNGLPDLFIAGGANAAALYRNQSHSGGSLAFGRVEDAATGKLDVMGAYPIDIDGDGHVDLAVLRGSGAELLRGLGDCRFERGERGMVLRPARDMDDRVQCHVGGRGDAAHAGIRQLRRTRCVGKRERSRAPTTSSSGPPLRGSGYARPTPLTPGYCPLSMLFSDWDQSGRRDLRVSNDRHYYDNQNGQEQLWRIAANEPPHLYTADDGWPRDCREEEVGREVHAAFKAPRELVGQRRLPRARRPGHDDQGRLRVHLSGYGHSPGLGTWRRDRVTVLAHTFEMELDRLANELRRLLARLRSGHAAGQSGTYADQLFSPCSRMTVY